MEQFGMFAKHWRPGKVKTRLAATLGDSAAGELYRCFVETLAKTFALAGDRRVLAYWPADSREAFVELAGDNWILQCQSEGDLGERMAGYFDQAFAGGAKRAVLIGSDSPDLPAEHVDKAFRLLRTKSVVLGPTYDGGYYLVGAARQTPPIFRGIAWSSSSVWEQTTQRLQAACVDFAALPRWLDVDDEADLRQLQLTLGDRTNGGSPLDDLRTAVEAALAHSSRSEFSGL